MSTRHGTRRMFTSRTITTGMAHTVTVSHAIRRYDAAPLDAADFVVMNNTTVTQHGASFRRRHFRLRCRAADVAAAILPARCRLFSRLMPALFSCYFMPAPPGWSIYAAFFDMLFQRHAHAIRCFFAASHTFRRPFAALICCLSIAAISP